MKIRINGEETLVQSDTLDDLLDELGHEKGSVATALNKEFVPRSQRKSCAIVENDSVDIIAPMAGG